VISDKSCIIAWWQINGQQVDIKLAWGLTGSQVGEGREVQGKGLRGWGMLIRTVLAWHMHVR